MTFAAWRWLGGPTAPGAEAAQRRVAASATTPGAGDRPYLRRASPAVLTVLAQLRSGEVSPSALPLDPSGVSAEANRLFGVERQEVAAWLRASQQHRRITGRGRRPCPEVEGWAPQVRRKYGVEGEFQASEAER